MNLILRRSLQRFATVDNTDCLHTLILFFQCSVSDAQRVHPVRACRSSDQIKVSVST